MDNRVAPTLVRLSRGGRVVIPAAMRRTLDMRVGDGLLVFLHDGEIRLTTVGESVRRAQEKVRRYVPAERSLVSELIAERRREAEREQVGS